ncbi:endonuclease/exonuclease/phosphatase family protein [Enterococcus faecalis]|uniref:endonuclease/exonuclease/phosphatase family protein n=1 Tax=Enterococcus faecalis TaxID=1351 RepID=UPI0025B0B709|nr:endonuclease/exonuclease/phosphatase family protein [Enterococcus faecalis]MDN3077064.1 endonuclease/exonuclease/phosphatase family protein [Enterococcus faecalis]
MRKKICYAIVFCTLALILVGCSYTNIASSHTQDSTKKRILTKEKMDTNRIRIGTFNLASMKDPDFDAQNRLINNTKAEIVGLQELDYYTKRQNVNMLKEIAQKDFPIFKFSKAIDWEDQGEYGIGIISKYKIQNYDSGIYNKTGEEDRTWQKITINTNNNKKLSIYNTHLSFETIDIRKSQINELLNIVKKDPAEYKVIVGDFNIDQSKDEWKIFTDKGYKISNGKNNKWYDTYTGRDETMKVFSVDNIVVSDNIEIKRVNMTVSPVSDHNMLYSDLVLN